MRSTVHGALVNARYNFIFSSGLLQVLHCNQCLFLFEHVLAM
jgi:hypothetical protein